MGARKPSNPAADQRSAAYREYTREVTSAWKRKGKADVAFGNALNLAVTIKVTTPLAEYIEGHQLTEGQRRELGGWIRTMQVGRRGAPRHQAERDAAMLVATWKRVWREKHQRQRVPRHVTAEIRKRAKKEAAKAHHIDEDEINENGIDDLLRTRRVKPMPK